MGAIFPDGKRAAVLQEALDEILPRLKTLDVAKIILFGSLARGEAAHGADLDLIVVMETDAGIGSAFLGGLKP